MPEEERDYRRELYESYKEDRKELNGTAITISERYDQNMLYVGAGALAVSLTFIENIAPNPKGWTLVFLGAAWLCLVLSVLSHLLALAYSQKAIRRQMEILDADYSRYLHSDSPESEIVKEGDGNQNIFSKRTGFFSQCAITLVILGVALLCIFSVISLNQKTKDQNERSEETSPAPSASTTAPAS